MNDMPQKPPIGAVEHRGDGTPSADETDMPLPTNPQTIFLGLLFTIAAFWVMSVAQEVILPVVIALVLKLLLQPLVRLLHRVHIPRAIGALLAVVLLLGVFAALGGILSAPTTKLVHDFPGLVDKAQDRFKSAEDWLHPLLERVGLGNTAPLSQLHVNPADWATAVAGGASSFASHLLETLLILYYFLVFGEVFMRRLVEILPHFRDKKQAVMISDQVEHDISMYLLTISIINAVVGLAAGIVMWLFGVPGAVVWGVLAFCFNYVPILGPITGILLFAVVGLATLGAAWAALLPAVCYLGIHVAEGELITPMILARRFTLNPIAVMVGLIFWFWLWGVQGAILSVPLLAIAKIVSDRIRPFKALGHLLEG